MKKYIGHFAIAIFILSLGAHIATFFPSLPISMTHTWWLHLAALGTFIPMVISSVYLQKTYAEPEEGLTARQRQNRFQFKLIKMVPLSIRLGIGVIFFYAVFNFFAMMANIEGGAPAFEDGVYYLHSHGDKIRDLTVEEYKRMRAFEVRGFSGHWMLFSALPAAFFTWVFPRFGTEK